VAQLYACVVGQGGGVDDQTTEIEGENPMRGGAETGRQLADLRHGSRRRSLTEAGFWRADIQQRYRHAGRQRRMTIGLCP
jgi:hypothetical protein